MKDIEQMEVPSPVTMESGPKECLNVPVSHFPYSELLPALPYSCHVFSTSVPKWYTLEMFCLIQLRLFPQLWTVGTLLFWRMLTSVLRVALFWGQMLPMYNEDNSIKQRACQASGNWSNEDIRCCKFS